MVSAPYFQSSSTGGGWGVTLKPCILPPLGLWREGHISVRKLCSPWESLEGGACGLGPKHGCVLVCQLHEYHHSTKLYWKISQVCLLPSVLLQVRNMSHNANGYKRMIVFPV